MSKYKAIVFDIDGTAVPNSPSGQPSPRLIKTVARYRHSVHLVAATGRPIRDAMPIFSQLGLTDPCIVSGGTIILNPTNQTILKYTPLPSSVVHAVYELVKGRGYKIAMRDEAIDQHAKRIHPRIADDIEIIFVGLIPPTDVEDLKTAFARIPGISADLVPDWYDPQCLAFTVTHLMATKEHAVIEVLRLLGVAPADTIGVGDGNNDLHLFRSVGLKVAMGNAMTELKAAADVIAPSVDDDGLAEIIERYAS